MTIQPADIVHRLSAPAAASGSSVAQPSPSASLGKFVSTTALVDNTLHNLFPAVDGAAAATGVVRYLCLFVCNTAAELLTAAKVRLLSQQPGGATVAIGVDPTAASALNSGSPQAVTVASMTTAPAGVAFAMPLLEADALSLGNLAANTCRAIWLRLTMPADGTAMAPDDAVYEVFGETT